MARKEPFTPIWNYDNEDEKKDRKKMTVRELDRERGKREAPPKEEEEPKQYVGMFAEDRASHRMTKKKEKTIAVVVVVVALVVTVLLLVLRVKWQRQLMSRYMSAPQAPRSVTALAETPSEARPEA